MFQPHPLAAGFLVTEIPAIGRIEKKAIDRLRGDVCFQGVGVQQLVQTRRSLCDTPPVQLNAVALSERVTLMAGELRQRTAATAAGVKAFHRFG